LGAGAVTATAPATPVAGRWRRWRWVAAAVVAIITVAVITAWLSTPRPGGRMDPDATSSNGAHALVTLLRNAGVDVVIAGSAEQARAAARPDTLLLIAQTYYLSDDSQLRTLADAPGDRLILEPATATREILTPELMYASSMTLGMEPGCDLRAAQRAGLADLGSGDHYQAASDTITLTRCYDGALVRYRNDGRTVTVAGTADFMTNGGLLREGNAALAMNLAGERPRLIWYAPQRAEGENPRSTTITDLIPEQVDWIVYQLWLVVLLAAIWRGRRLGPLVAEKLPVVVRVQARRRDRHSRPRRRDFRAGPRRI